MSGALSWNAKYVAQSLVNRPGLRGLEARQLANALRVPQQSAREGIASVVDLAKRMGRGELAQNDTLAHAIGPGMSLDGAMARYGSNAAAPTYSARPSWARRTNAGADDATDQGGDAAPNDTPIISGGDNLGAQQTQIKEAPRPAPGPGPAPAPTPKPPAPTPSLFSRVPWYVLAAGAGAVALVVFGKKKKKK